MDNESQLEWLAERFYLGDHKYEDGFTELSVPTEHSHNYTAEVVSRRIVKRRYIGATYSFLKPHSCQ